MVGQFRERRGHALGLLDRDQRVRGVRRSRVVVGLERACAVPAASVIVENVVAFEVARALVEKFGNDSLAEMLARFDLFQKLARER